MKSPNVWRLHSAPSSCLSGRTYLEPCTRMTTMGNAEVLDAMSECFWFILLVPWVCYLNNDAILRAEFNYPRASAFWFAWRLKNSDSVCCHQLRLFFTVRWELNNSTILLSTPVCHPWTNFVISFDSLLFIICSKLYSRSYYSLFCGRSLVDLRLGQWWAFFVD